MKQKNAGPAIHPGWRGAVFLALCIFRPVAGAAPPPPAPNLPDHPRLLLDGDGVTQLKTRVATVAWAKASWASLKAQADRSLAKPILLPPRGGNWSHNYVCPKHGARLEQGKQIGPWQWEHLCPAGNHTLRGDPSKASLDFDGNAISRIHGRYAEEVVENGLLWQVTGDARYASRAREILRAYANAYLAYPLHDNQGHPGKGGHVASQSLTEASWLIDIAQGADLVWNKMSRSEQRALELKVLRPALEQIILPTHLGIHNIQCRHNSAIGLVGFLLGDKELIRMAIDDPVKGFRQQLEQGVREDGMWTEGSSGYHFFTIAGLWPLAEAARNCGIDLYSTKFKSMFDGPLALAMPNLVLPNFNDSGTVPLDHQADLYELAFARFQNPAYLRLLEQSTRHGRLALLYGTPLPAEPRRRAGSCITSRNFPASGYAILRRGQDSDATWLCMKYGPHGGGHGHPDKLTFVLYAGGEIIATDAGTHAYGSSLHKDWDKTTFAHNTLVMDQQSQQQATGKCLAFGSEGSVDYCVLEAGPIYGNVRFNRTAALLTQKLVVFVDEVYLGETAPPGRARPHTFDLLYHQTGRWAKRAGSAAWQELSWTPPDQPGYRHLTQAFLQHLPSGTATLEGCTEHSRQALTICACQPTDLIKGYGLLKTTEDLTPLLIQRHTGGSTAFVWAVSLDGERVELSTCSVKEATGQFLPLWDAIQVQVRSGTNAWFLLVNPARKKVVASTPSAPAFTTDAPFSVRLTVAE